jgi:hypothetical protein
MVTDSAETYLLITGTTRAIERIVATIYPRSGLLKILRAIWGQFRDIVSLPTVFKQLSPYWRSLVKQAAGCMASAWARLAAEIGEVEATRFLENEWGCKIPEKVIEVGLMQKARFAHLN